MLMPNQTSFLFFAIIITLYNEIVTISKFQLLQHARFQFEFDSSALEPQVRQSKYQKAAKLQ